MAQSSDLLRYYAQLDSLSVQITDEFKKPIHKNRFFTNKEYLILNSKIIKFSEGRWHLRPEFFTSDYYDSPGLFPVILVVNDISTRFNFTESNLKGRILCPTRTAMENVLNQMIG